MASPPVPDQQRKRQTLRRHGTLNPEPDSVTHPLFHRNDFFDPDDLIQVKYEMLRQVHVDSSSISESARALSVRIRLRFVSSDEVAFACSSMRMVP